MAGWGTHLVLLCGVTLLQFMEKSSRSLGHRARGVSSGLEMIWKLDHAGFHATVLVYFRDRSEDNKVERMIFRRYS